MWWKESMNPQPLQARPYVGARFTRVGRWRVFAGARICQRRAVAVLVEFRQRWSSFLKPQLPNGRVGVDTDPPNPFAPRQRLTQICLFLLTPSSLSLYFQPLCSSAAVAAFSFCGAVSFPAAPPPLPPLARRRRRRARPRPSVPAKIGVSIEDLAAVPSMDASAEKRVEKMAMKVAENLFNFMQSFCGVDGLRLVVPMDIPYYTEGRGVVTRIERKTKQRKKKRKKIGYIHIIEEIRS